MLAPPLRRLRRLYAGDRIKASYDRTLFKLDADERIRGFADVETESGPLCNLSCSADCVLAVLCLHSFIVANPGVWKLAPVSRAALIPGVGDFSLLAACCSSSSGV
jgi:hypothetical protein